MTAAEQKERDGVSGINVSSRSAAVATPDRADLRARIEALPGERFGGGDDRWLRQSAVLAAIDSVTLPPEGWVEDPPGSRHFSPSPDSFLAGARGQQEAIDALAALRPSPDSANPDIVRMMAQAGAAMAHAEHRWQRIGGPQNLHDRNVKFAALFAAADAYDAEVARSTTSESTE